MDIYRLTLPDKRIILNNIMLVKEITQGYTYDIAKLQSALGGEQSRKQIATIVRKFAQEQTGERIKVTTHSAPQVDSGSMNLGAYYDPENDEDEEGHIIELQLAFSPKDKTLKWSEEGKRYFVNELADVLKHEMLHAQQHRSRDFHPGRDGYDQRDSNYEYMTRPDEIEAYAMNIADELVRKAGKDGALELLRMAGKTAQFKDEMGNFLSPNLMAYFAMFDWRAEHPVMKRLLKRIYQFIN